MKANVGDYAYVADRAQELIRLLKTPSALYLAAKGIWEANRPEQCLRLLNDHTDVFPGGNLPTDLRRLKIHCQERLGLITEAVAGAELLAHENSTAETVFTLIDMQLRKGDLKGLAVAARPLARALEAKPAELLRVARLVSLDDRDLAQQLWRKALETAKTDPKLMFETIAIGVALGRDKELHPVTNSLHELASQGEGPFRLVDVKDLLAERRREMEHQDFASGLYDRAEIPIHLLAETLSLTLAKVYHQIPETNEREPDPTRQPSVLTRHGGRRVEEAFCGRSQGWRLHLDISALLLAAHLDILNAVEQSFNPLHISSVLQLALVRQYDRLRSHQPSQLESYRQIIQLLDSGKLKATSSVLTEALLTHL